jgi:colanic acid/amylovoran biosynthesis glycosyltransferase
MAESLKIIIFDGSFKTTTFINKLMKGLVQQHEVYVLGFNEYLQQPVAGVRYISLGSNQNYFRLARVSITHAIKSKSFITFIKALKHLFLKQRKVLQKQNLSEVLKKINPDIIHLQWLSNIAVFEEYIEKGLYVFVLSQRGYHSNVRPFIDVNNFDYLKKWYPKISGFHSVSKAISLKGDMVYSNSKKINHVVYTGIDINEINFKKKYGKLPFLKLISVGRPHWIKGYIYALHSCKQLKDKGLKFTYLIIGAADNEELQYMVSDFGLQDYVILSPKLSQSKVFALMQESSLLLMPSIEEGIPNVVVEAMTLGTPVISTVCGGMKELITHGIEGWTVPLRDSEVITQTILDFLKLPLNEIEVVRIAARKKIESQHSEQKMVTDMLQLYEKTIK